MKQGGVSWNQSGNAKSGVTTRFKCEICGRQYKMFWAKQIHQRQCEEYNKEKSEEFIHELIQ